MESTAVLPIVSIRNILLLDDDVDLVETLELSLESSDFVVTTANDGVEGLKQAMALDFDVVICDLMMPAMPGDMFYRALQRTKPHLCERFIFITGHAGDPKVDAFLASTQGIVLQKPISMKDLLQAIEVVLGKNSP